MTDVPRVGERQHPWFDELFELESEILTPNSRADRGRLDELLRDDFVEVGSSGRVYEKWLLIDMIANETHGKVVIRDFTVKDIMPEVALVSYRSVGDSGQVRRTSIWVREFGRWKMVFHQGTRLPDVWQPRG